MATLIGSPVGKVAADRDLMVSSNQIHIVGNLIGRRPVIRRESSSTETEATAGDGELHLARSVGIGINADIRWREKTHIRPPNCGAVRRQSKCVDRVGADQVRAAEADRMTTPLNGRLNAVHDVVTDVVR